MQGFTPAFSRPSRKRKGLVKLFGGISAPWYFTTEVVAEGTPMVLDLVTPDKMNVATTTQGASVAGLALQETYDEAAFGQLKGYHFANDTRQRLDGNPIGLLMGAGWAATLNYTGAVSYGKQASVAASGKLKDGTSDGASSKLPVWFEGSGTNGDTLVRIRFDFPVATRV